MSEKKVEDKQILDFLVDYWDKNDHGPSVREIGEGVGLKSTNTVHTRLESLRKKNLVKNTHRPNCVVAIDPLTYEAKMKKPSNQKPKTYISSSSACG